MAGFQVTINGRFWVTTEDIASRDIRAHAVVPERQQS
jgi:hypothetical protein